MKSRLISTGKFMLTAGLLFAALSQIRWRDRVKLIDGRSYPVLQKAVGGYEIVAEAGTCWIPPAEVFEYTPGLRSLCGNLRPAWGLTALIVQTLTTLLIAIRWGYLIRLHSPVSYSEAIEWFFKSRAATAIPIGQLAPDAYRMHVVARAGKGYAVSIAVLLIERLVGFSAMAILAGGGLLFLKETIQIPKTVWMFAAVCLVGPCLMLLTVRSLVSDGSIKQKALAVSGHRSFHLQKFFRLIDEARNLGRAWPRVMVLSLLIHVSAALDYVCIDRMLGLNSPVSAFLISVPLVNLVLALPIHIAGLGVLEGGLVVMLGLTAGLNPTQALGIAAAARLVGLAWLPVTLAFLWKSPSGVSTSAASDTVQGGGAVPVRAA